MASSSNSETSGSSSSAESAESRAALYFASPGAIANPYAPTIAELNAIIADSPRFATRGLGEWR